VYRVKLKLMVWGIICEIWNPNYIDTSGTTKLRSYPIL